MTIWSMLQNENVERASLTAHFPCSLKPIDTCQERRQGAFFFAGCLESTVHVRHAHGEAARLQPSKMDKGFLRLRSGQLVASLS